MEIPLTKGLVAVVDDADAELVGQYKWHATNHGPITYAASSALRRKGGSVIYLHRLILGASKGDHVDHRNGDGLDCRRENIRLCTNAENRRNMRKVRGISKFKGVSADRKNGCRTWVSYIWFENKKIHLGSYPTEIEAARAYNAAALIYHKDFARLNEIPELSYEESISAPFRNTKPGPSYSVGRACRTLHDAAA